MEAMNQFLAMVSIVVDDYDEAIDFYTRKLGFEIIEDTPIDQNSAVIHDGRPRGWQR